MVSPKMALMERTALMAPRQRARTTQTSKSPGPEAEALALAADGEVLKAAPEIGGGRGRAVPTFDTRPELRYIIFQAGVRMK